MSDITRSEAIDLLDNLIGMIEDNHESKYDDALKLAIASLQTDEAYNLMYEQPEFCADCISRNAVMDMIIEYRDSLADIGKKDALERAYGANYVGMKIADMPSVLPNVPDNNVGNIDCISRADVLKLMQDNWHTHNGDWAMQESMDDIRALHSVTPIRPKGHWIEYSWNDNGIARWGLKCDKCHKKYKYGGVMWNNPNFCPNCGSDNREVEE